MEQYDPNFFDMDDTEPVESVSPKIQSESKSDLLNHLECLCELARKVDNPSFAVSSEELISLLVDLGLCFRQSSLKVNTNDDVFEDPQNRGDSLGNVLMIHRKENRLTTEILEEVGLKLCQLAHDVSERLHHESVAISNLSASYSMDPLDDTNSEDILAAKALIRSLRKDNDKIDYRNLLLIHKNNHLKRKLEKLQGKFEDMTQIALRYQHAICNHSKNLPIDLQQVLTENEFYVSNKSTPSVSEKTCPQDLCTVEEDGQADNQSRQLEGAKLSDSQLEIIRW